MKKYLGILMLGMVLLMAVPQPAQAQCPMCKAAVESSHGDEPNPLAEGLNTGILYLFVLPYLAFGVIGFFWYRAYRSKNKAELVEEFMQEQAARLPDGLDFQSHPNDGN